MRDPGPCPNNPASRVNLADTTETSHWRFCAEASTLGLKPGQNPPREIGTDIGNGMPFVAVRSTEDLWEYTQANGCCSLVIFND